MANAYVLNYTLNTSVDQFSAIWKLSRAMLSAGWKYKASGNGNSGTVDHSNNAALDWWGVDGAVNLQNASRGTGSGSGVSIGAAVASTGASTITGVSSFTSASVGDYLTITGSGSGNNGSFRITAQTGTTVTVFAPQLVAETSNSSLAVVEQYGGADGSITTYSTTTTGQSTLINFTTSSFTGFTTTDVGRMITILNSGSGNNGTYLIAGYVANNHILLHAGPECTPTVTINDSQNPTLQWVEYSPLNQIYPSYIQNITGNGCWIVLQGPTIMKIPIGTNVPVGGTFIRGENITQSTTGAQGELLGIVTDTSGGTGYLVVAPRVVGTGVQAGPFATYGWNNSANTDTITGAFSGVTITTPASSTPIAYIAETCIYKNYNNSGLMWHQRIDQNSSTESATTASTGRLSTMAGTLSQVTSILAPGGSTGGNCTTNGFSTSWTGTYAVLGQPGQGGGGSYWSYWSVVSPTSPGRAQLIAANCVPQQGVSADGTWFYLQSCNSTGYQMLSYLRLDNQEDGDLDPYVHQGHWSGSLNAAANRSADTVTINGAGSATDNCRTDQTWIANSTGGHGFKGFRRRGLSGETYNWFSVMMLYDFGAAVFPLQTNTGNPDQVGTAVTTTYVRDQLWLYLSPYTAQLASGRMRKGTPRWLQLCQGASVNSTFDSLQWIVLTSASAISQMVVGPWDGVTTPSF
jgi:hypothetical protein